MRKFTTKVCVVLKAGGAKKKENEKTIRMEQVCVVNEDLYDVFTIQPYSRSFLYIRVNFFLFLNAFASLRAVGVSMYNYD